MDTYLCYYFSSPKDKGLFDCLYFKCEADNKNHAEEQLLNAEPEACDIFCEIYQRN